MYEGLVNNLRKAADEWEKKHPFIAFGELRVHDALRDAARALKEADDTLERVTLERDAAVKALVLVDEKVEQAQEALDNGIFHCVDYSTYLSLRNMVDAILSWHYEDDQRGVKEE